MNDQPESNAPPGTESGSEPAAPDPTPAPRMPDTRFRYGVALVIGFLCAVVIWIVNPINNLWVGNFSVGDSYLPLYAMTMLLCLVLVANPLLYRFARRAALTSRQLAVILGILLIAIVPCGYGMLRNVPYGLAQLSITVRESKPLAEEFEAMKLSPRLFPDTIGYAADTPVADDMIGEVAEGERVPWRAWLWPALTWGVFMVFIWSMMLGLALIVFPQWRHNERLAFPLLTVYHELIRDPKPGRMVAPLFTSYAFWGTAGVVLLLHTLQGAAEYNPERIPAIPLSWDLASLFTEDPWRHLPTYVFKNQVYFAFIGIAYFMPNRISFSIWFFALLYAFYQVVCRMYFPAVQILGTVSDHRTGAMLMMAVFILWLGRAQWARVFRAMVRRPKTDEEGRNQIAGRLFLFGCVGIVAWLVWAGAQAGWALYMLGFAFVVALVISRIVCETGVPFLRTYSGPFTLMALAPTAWISGASAFFCVLMGSLISIPSRVCVTALGAHALGLTEAGSAVIRRRLVLILLVILVAAFVICGASHLHVAYHNSMPNPCLIGARENINTFGFSILPSMKRPLLERAAGELSRPTYNRVGHTVFGALLAGGLQLACLAMPQWPLHPVGIMMVYISYGRRTWVSVFLGWLIKTLLVKYGGSRLYKALRPAFLGLILGEIFATLLWGIVPVILLSMKHPYKIFDVLPF